MGEAIYLSNTINFTVDNYSLVIFCNNTVMFSGSLVIINTGFATFKGNSVVKFLYE